jgi:3-dehydrotetronate 4-kinase
MPILLGCIADDFTGATDLANTLVKNGIRATQLIGVPSKNAEIGDAEAVVVALKSRTAPVQEAVSASLAALKWLQANGARQIFFKYCSTFDSTPAGNIGPVADALMDALKTNFSIVCPAFPGAGRTIYLGHLFVGAQLLSDSSMRNHPLTPMTDSSLVRLMAAQSRGEVGVIPYSAVDEGVAATKAAIQKLIDAGMSYGVVDALSDRHLMTIGEAIASHALVTGGSGVALGLPENFRRAGFLGEAVAPSLPQANGRAVVLAGSCSTATLGQIAHASKLWPHQKLDIDRIAAGVDMAGEVSRWALEQPEKTPLLIYGSAPPDEVKAIQARHGREKAGAMMEETLGKIAKKLVDGGARRLIVAGGETAGAVVSNLGIEGLKIGREIDPGVPWTESIGEPKLALALKSGNFGGVDFFSKAFGMLK